MSRPDLSTTIHRLDPEHLTCRDLGHTWSPTGTITRDYTGFFRRVITCGSCSTKRVDLMTSSGTIYRRSYEYPEGYRLYGFGHLTQRRAQYRRVMLERTFGDEVDTPTPET